MPLLKIDIDYDENDEKMLQDFFVQMTEMFEKAGFTNIRTHDSKQAPGLDIHEMGGVRMGEVDRQRAAERAIAHTAGFTGSGDSSDFHRRVPRPTNWSGLALPICHRVLTVPPVDRHCAPSEERAGRRDRLAPPMLRPDTWLSNHSGRTWFRNRSCFGSGKRGRRSCSG